MGNMINRHKQIVTVLMIVALLASTLAGCSSSRTSARINDKLELAVKYLSEQKFEEAILAYQEVIKVDSKNVTAYKGMSLAYTLQEKPDQAQQALQDGLKAVPDNVQLKLAMAGFMLDQGDAGQAEAIYQGLVSGENPSIPACQAYAAYLTRAGKTTQALAFLEQAVAKNARSYQLHALLAEHYTEMGDKDKALTAVNQSLAMEPNQAGAYATLIKLYQNKWDELIRLGQQYVLQGQVTTGNLLVFTGLLGMGKYEDIVQQYTTLTTDSKESARIRLMAARAYSKLGQPDRSVDLLKPIPAASLTDAGMLAELAGCFLDNGDKASARLYAQQGLQADPSAIDNYAVMYRSYADEDKALAQVWAVKYLLASSLSLKDGLARFTAYGLAAGFLQQSKSEVNPQKIVGLIVRDQAYAQKMLQSQPDLPTMTSAIYLDTRNNIAYRGVSEKATAWKPYLVRYHSPAICSATTLPADIVANIDRSYKGGWTGLQQHWQSENPQGITKYLPIHSGMPQGANNWVLPVVREDNIPFEEYLKSAGYPIENITFIDM